MPRMTVPGLKKSTGLTEFLPLVDGDYTLEFTKVEVKPPKNPAPMDVWHMSTKVIEGPKQANGKPAKSYKFWITIKQDTHPDYTEEQFSVDELKSICVAAGVAIKGDELNPESFVGTRVRVHISQKPNYRDPARIDNVNSGWSAAE